MCPRLRPCPPLPDPLPLMMKIGAASSCLLKFGIDALFLTGVAVERVLLASLKRG